MPEGVRLREHLSWRIVRDGDVVLSSDSRRVILRGAVYSRLVQLLVSGYVSRSDCAYRLAETDQAERVYWALDRLQDLDLIAEGSVPHLLSGPEERAYWDSYGLAPERVAKQLAECAVEFSLVENQFSREAWLGSFRRAGIVVADSAPLAVVVTSDYTTPTVATAAGQARRSGQACLLTRPAGRQIWIGPLLLPDAAGCWDCLADRLQTNRPVETFADPDQAGESIPLGASAATRQLAIDLAAGVALSWIVRRTCDAIGRLRVVDTSTWETSWHDIVPRADCGVCGDGQPSSRPGHRLKLESRQKNFTRDGGHRARSPEETLDRLQCYVSPLTGFVTSLDRTTPSRAPIHVYASTQNLARRHRDLRDLRGSLNGGKSGKGASDAQAKASALCEALERSSGLFRGDEERRCARLADLGDDAVHPASIMLFSEQQYAKRATWNGRPTRYNLVPAPFDDNATVSWTPVWSLTNQVRRWVPTAQCYYGFVDRDVAPFAISCSNGSAAGGNLEEAILQGLFEVIERDSVAIWWYNRVRRPAVDLDSFAEPYLDRVREFLAHNRRRDLAVLDITSDLTVPVFVATSRRVDRSPERILLGFGAHFDARIAVLRAVTELVQMLSWMAPVDEDPPEPMADAESHAWLVGATLHDHPYLRAESPGEVRRVGDYQLLWHGDIRRDVEAGEQILADAGLEMLVLDQTRRDIDLSVVKVIVPGLRHFWARFAPGRLYDVPLRLGWLDRPVRESELNPIPMFI
jgi:ribosomal protein S12 methylthiotransferase accessory factor